MKTNAPDPPRRHKSKFSSKMNSYQISTRTVVLMSWLALGYRLAFAQCSLPSGLLAWWQGDGDASDFLGANNGSLSGGVGFVPGKVGQGFSFNGADAVVELPYIANLAKTNVTVDAWVKPMGPSSDPGPGGQAVLFGQSEGGPQLLVRLGSDGAQVVFSFMHAPGNFPCAVSNQKIPMGDFSHVAGTFDGTTAKIYINGILDAQQIMASTPAISTCPFWIGGCGSSPASSQCIASSPQQHFNGVIDEVHVFNRELSSAEIAAIYAAGSTGICTGARRARATATVVNGFVVGIDILDGGWGYTNGAPSVDISGGDGSGATAIAEITNGVVSGITVTNPGEGYTVAPAVLVASPPFTPWLDIAVSRVKVAQHLVVGNNYVLQSSTDLQTWTQVGPEFTAQDEVVTQEFEVDVIGRYFRILQLP